MFASVIIEIGYMGGGGLLQGFKGVLTIYLLILPKIKLCEYIDYIKY